MTIDYSNVMKDKTDYLSFEEIESMLHYCIEEGKARDYMLILTLFRTARRITEIVGEKPYTRKVGLRPCDLHPDGLIEFDILKKNHIKTKTKLGKERDPQRLLKKRLFKMPKRCLKAVDTEYYGLLQDYIESEYISKHQRVFPITRQRAWKIISTVAKECNITRPNSKIHPHSFRHSYAIFLLKSNPNDAATLRQVQDLLDHSNINMTMHYANFVQQDKIDMLDRVFGR